MQNLYQLQRQGSSGVDELLDHRDYKRIRATDQILLFLLAAIRAEKGNPMSAEEIARHIERALEKHRSENE